MPRGQATAFRLGLEKRRADEVLEWRTFAAAHESAFGPKPEWRPSSGDIRSWGDSGLACHRVRMAALDPEPSSKEPVPCGLEREAA